MKIFQWLERIFPLLLSGETKKIETVIEEDYTIGEKDYIYAVSAYWAGTIIRIDIKPS